MKKAFTTLAFISLLPLLVTAQWNWNTALPGKAVCTAPTSEGSKISITDGSNGSIVVFQSSTYNSATQTSSNKICVQRITSTGVIAWGSVNSPVAVSETASGIYLADAIPDGTGGAFISWEREFGSSESSGEAYVQHINNAGNATWGNGINVSNNNTRYNEFPRLCIDGAGGIIVSWTATIYDEILDQSTYAQAFAQRYNSNGVPQWTAGSVQVCTATGFRGYPDMVSDGAGGAIAIFIDTRNSSYGEEFDEYPNLDIYAQRLSSTGARLWTDNGADFCTEPNAQYTTFGLVSDGAGGAIGVFEDYRTDNDAPNNLYAQRINSAGVKQWAAGGVSVCIAAGYQSLSSIISNGENGMVAIWNDQRVSTNTRVYTQQINASGTAVWASNGRLLSNTSDNSRYCDIKADGLGNYIATWDVSTTNNSASTAIKAQKINAASVNLWAAGGIYVYNNPNSGSIYNPEVVLSDNGKAIVIWSEYLSDGQADIFANKLDPSGVLPLTLLNFTATPLQQKVLLKWLTASEQNTLNFELQRSSDNLQFTTIATVNASGYSTTNTNYNFTDVSPLTGTSYYRLKQNDKDGAFTYSAVKQVTLSAGTYSSAVLLSNPVKSEAVLKYISPGSYIAQVRVVDYSGKVVLIKQVNVINGTNLFRLSTAALARGVYEVQVIAVDQIQHVKMLKE